MDRVKRLPWISVCGIPLASPHYSIISHVRLGTGVSRTHKALFGDEPILLVNTEHFLLTDLEALHQQGKRTLWDLELPFQLPHAFPLQFPVPFWQRVKADGFAALTDAAKHQENDAVPCSGCFCVAPLFTEGDCEHGMCRECLNRRAHCYHVAHKRLRFTTTSDEGDEIDD